MPPPVPLLLSLSLTSLLLVLRKRRPVRFVAAARAIHRYGLPPCWLDPESSTSLAELVLGELQISSLPG